MGSLNRTTIRDHLYEELKQRIINRIYRAGTRLNIDRLARELHVSNTPLREALTRLESDGLVATRPNQGIRVVNLDAKIVAEVDQTVYALLLGAYELCRERGVEKELTEILDGRLQTQWALLALEDDLPFLQAGIFFDRGFMEVTANERLMTLYDRQAAMVCLVVTKNNDTPPHELQKREENLRQHQAILTAVSRRDQGALRGLLARHYRQSGLPGDTKPIVERI